MPAIEPILPPIVATRKRVDSGIRKPLFLAFSLSIPISRNPIKLTVPIYNRITIVTDIKYILHHIFIHCKRIKCIKINKNNKIMHKNMK